MNIPVRHTDDIAREWIFAPGEWPWDADRDLAVACAYAESRGRTVAGLDPEVRAHSMFFMMKRFFDRHWKDADVVERVGIANDRLKAEMSMKEEG